MNRLFTVTLLMFCLSPALGIAGNISGQVTDASGRPVAMAWVSVGSRSDITDVHGKFRLTNVPEGQQRLQVKNGNAAVTLNVTVGPNTTQPVKLP